MPIKIDAITESDLPALALLYEQLSNTKPNIGRMRTVFKEIETDKNYRLIGIKIHGQLAGSLMAIVCKDLVKACRPFVVIENVVVDRSYRNKGLGRKLMVYIEEISRQLGCYYIMFVSGIEKQEAHNFYDSLGYSKDTVKGFKKYLPLPGADTPD